MSSWAERFVHPKVCSETKSVLVCVDGRRGGGRRRKEFCLSEGNQTFLL